MISWITESERLERKTKTNLNELSLEKENNENIAERFLRVSSRTNTIELNVILRDSAMESITLEQEFNREAERSATFYSTAGNCSYVKYYTQLYLHLQLKNCN